jgi:hypothetical protein
MGRNTDPVTHAAVATYKYGWSIFFGVLRADDSAVNALEDAVRIAEGSSDNAAMGILKLSLGVALVSRDAGSDRRRGLELLMDVRATWLGEQDRYGMPLLDIYVARQRARNGDRGAAITVLRDVVNELLRAGRLTYGVLGAGMLVETLVEGGGEGDLAEAREVIDRLANLPGTKDWAILEIALLRLRALLARAGIDESAYGDLVIRYREMAKSLGFEGHIAMAGAM